MRAFRLLYRENKETSPIKNFLDSLLLIEVCASLIQSGFYMFRRENFKCLLFVSNSRLSRNLSQAVTP